MEAQWLAFIVSVTAWLTPLPTYAHGKLVWYGSQGLVEANAEYRGYDLSPYKDRCGIAAMSPADLGKIMWLRTDAKSWYGPCLVVDVAARHHFARAVWYVGEIVEVSTIVRKQFKFRSGIAGQVYVGQCPPADAELGLSQAYDPPLVEDIYSPNRAYSFYPYPEQEWPIGCSQGR